MPMACEMVMGDCIKVMSNMADGCIDLVFTSPPYYNAKSDYVNYDCYEDYIDDMLGRNGLGIEVKPEYVRTFNERVSGA